MSKSIVRGLQLNLGTGQSLQARSSVDPAAEGFKLRRTRDAWVFVRATVFFSELAAWMLALAMILLRKWWWAAASAVSALGADVVGRAWSRRSPVPLPHFMWWFLLLPRGPHSPKNLRRVLEPRSGERILEVGPGVGVHAQAVAAALRPDGMLDVLDVQQAMLDRLICRAARSGLTNIVPRLGDARKLPYAAGTFDAAYLVGVLGEVPDAVAALRELRRVLKPNGRLIIGELLIDPDFIPLPALREAGNEAGLTFERQAGPSFAYWATFRPRGGEAVAIARDDDADGSVEGKRWTPPSVW